MEDEKGPLTFIALPTEIHLRCLANLTLSSVASLALTCRQLNDLVRSDDVCKPYVKRLWREFGDGGGDEGVFEEQGDPSSYRWYRLWAFFRAHERYLGDVSQFMPLPVYSSVM